MRVVLQRVSAASVRADGDLVGQIGTGALLLVGVASGDGVSDADALAAKVAGLRIFPDAENRMNLSLLDVGGSALVVSQFTLLGSVSRGRRPSFTTAAAPEAAEAIVSRFAEGLAATGVPVEQGVFGARMEVELVNDGPVTIVLESAGGRVL